MGAAITNTSMSQKENPAIGPGEQRREARSVQDTGGAPSAEGDSDDLSERGAEDNGDEPQFSVRGGPLIWCTRRRRL